jgi:hypothetical protein
MRITQDNEKKTFPETPFTLKITEGRNRRGGLYLVEVVL